MSRLRSTLIVPLGLSLLGLVACSGSDSADNQVATLADDQTAAVDDSGAGDDEVTEEELLDWTQCLRDQGVDVPDPEVDSDGNLVLGGPRRGDSSSDDDGSTNADDQQPAFDRDDMEAAGEVCGDPPMQGPGGFSEEDRQEMQDAALEFAQCLRDQGIDVADPDFSQQGPGGDPGAGRDNASTDDGQDAAPRGPFGDVDLDDPEVQAAWESCQDSSGSAFPGGPGGPVGGPAGVGAGGSSGDEAAAAVTTADTGTVA